MGVDMGTPRSASQELSFFLLWLPLSPSRANDPSFLLTGTLLSLLSAPLQWVTPHGKSLRPPRALQPPTPARATPSGLPA